MRSVSFVKAYLSALICVWALSLIPCAYFVYQQALENRVIDGYLAQHRLGNLPITKATAVRISDTVRKDFNVRENTFVALKMANRPFLREDTRFLLTHKEGLCGEGTRVIIALLDRLGFDATRITLYDRQLQPAHTLVSVKIAGREFLLDSINSSAEWNALLRQDDISAAHFRITHYSGNIEERTLSAKSASGLAVPVKLVDFMKNHYWLYSYEAMPYTKLLAMAGLNVRVFNLERPSRGVSIAAEKPNTVMAVLAFLASLAVTAGLCWLGIVRRLAKMIHGAPQS